MSPRKKTLSSTVDEASELDLPVKKSRARKPRVSASSSRVDEDIKAMPSERDMDESDMDFNPTPHFYRTIALGFLGLTAILILAVLYFTGGSGEVTLFLKSRAVKADVALNVAPRVTAGNQVLGQVLSLPIKGVRTVAVTGGKEVPAPAVGKVIIYNNSNRNQPLVATTRFLTADNVLFRLKRAVSVLAGGQVEAEIYADKPGKAGEISPAKFTIPGLSEILQKSIFAESKAPMTGGTKFTNALTEEDIKKAGDDLIAQLFADGQKKLLAQLGSTTTFSAHQFKFENAVVKTEAKVGEETESFQVNAEAQVIGVFYDEIEVNKALAESLQSNVMDEEKPVSQPAAPVVELGKINLTAGTAELRATQEAIYRVDYTNDLLDQSKFLGEKKDKALEYFQSLPWIEKVEIEVAYAIGVAHPVSVMVETFGTEKVDMAKIDAAVREIFDLRPGAIVKDLDLMRPIYRKTASYGHFGRRDRDFTWEKLDKVGAIKSFFKI